MQRAINESKIYNNEKYLGIRNNRLRTNLYAAGCIEQEKEKVEETRGLTLKWNV